MKTYFTRFTLATAATLAMVACDKGTSSDSNEDSASQGLVLDFTVSSDYKSAELRWMSTDSSTLSTGAMPFYFDSRLAVNGSTLYVLERMGADNLNCVDLTRIGESAAVTQVALDDGSNPFDVAVSGGKAWVTLASASYLQAFNPTTCALGDKVDLSAYQQAGELSSNASAIVASGDTLLVLVQRLKSEVSAAGWTMLNPTLPGLLVRIDARTASVLDTIQLLYRNPAAAILHKGKLYVAGSGNLMDATTSDATRGLEVVDLATAKTTSLADGVALGGGAAAIALDEASGVLYTSVYAAYGNQPVKPVSLATGAVGAALPGVADSFGELAFDAKTGLLYIGDRTFGAEALKVYNGSTVQNVGAGNALAPYDLQVTHW